MVCISKTRIYGHNDCKQCIIRYDELQIFLINLVNTDFLFEVARKIYKKVKYPCLLILKYQDKFLVSTCQFDAGKVDRDNNLLHAVNFSHWIHADLLSPGASRMICEINEHSMRKVICITFISR